MNIIAWIILGGLAGWIASMLVGTNQRQGCLADMLVGIVGALLGGFIFSAFGFSGITGFNLYSLLIAVLGAVILLLLLRAFRRVT